MVAVRCCATLTNCNVPIQTEEEELMYSTSSLVDRTSPVHCGIFKRATVRNPFES
jgi:hypothetical protein